MLLSARNLSKSYGTRTLFTSVALSIESGERLGLIGPNGSGKSTLMKMLAGLETADSGDVEGRKGTRIAYVTQQDDFTPEEKALDVLIRSALAAHVPTIHDEHEAMVEAQMLLDRMGISDLAEVEAGVMSGGQRKRLAIAQRLIAAPDLLLLDEPTNHLDVEGIEWLEGVLTSGNFSSVVVTHDRSFLESCATRIVELSKAYPKGTFGIKGNYSEFLRRKQEFLDGQAKAEQSLANQVREDLRWLSRGAKARRTKSKSRIDASFDRMDELAALRDRNTVQQSAEIDWSASGRLTQKLVVARAITKTLGGKRLFTDVDLVLSPGTCLGLLGPNGSGKSTLIKVLTGAMEPDPPTPEAVKAAAEAVNIPQGTPPPGTVKFADKLKIVFFSQVRDELDLSLTLKEALSPQMDSVIYQGRSLHINTWARKFLFSAEHLKQPLRALSGGERARVHIARLMLQSADVLVLDEPTNDLDIPSLEVLEESIEEFPGAVVLVTHDRAMLADLATQILALDGEGGARMFTDYDQWMTFKSRPAAAKATAKSAAKAAAKVAAEKVAAKAAAQTVTAAVEPPAKKPSPVVPAPSNASASKKKLSYNDQRELAGIEEAIEKADQNVKKLEVEMNKADVFSNPIRLQQVCAELGVAQAAAAKLYARWEELEAKKG
jgi:ATP-binding cassette subfamily F protein uup